MRLITVVIGLFLIISCASIEDAPTSLDKEAKLFIADSNKAILYVYRDNIVNAGVAMDILISGRYVGKMRSGHFIKVPLSPGQYKITSRASNDRTISIEMQAGKLYFVKQKGIFKLLQHGTDLHEVSITEGKKAVSECTLVENIFLDH